MVVTNNPDAGVIARVMKYNSEHNARPVCLVRPRKDYQILVDGEVDKDASRLKYGEELIRIFDEFGVKFIAQHGWSVLTPENVIDAYAGFIYNSHPAPLDPKTHLDFGGQGMHGLAVYAAVLLFAKKVGRPFHTEVTLHEVTPQYDQGRVLVSSKVRIDPNDSEETLQARLKKVEINQNRDYARDIVGAGRLLKRSNYHQIIRFGEEQFLLEAKRLALEKFPKG